MSAPLSVEVQLRRLAICRDDLREPLNAVERATRPGDVPYWGANSIQGYVDKAKLDFPVVLLGEDGAPFFDRSRDVAFYRNEPIWPNNHIHVLVPREAIDGRWLAYALNSVDYSRVINGSTRDKLTQSAMMSIALPNTPPDEQRSIADFLDRETRKIDELITEQCGLIETLRERRKAVITRAVTVGIRGNGCMQQVDEPTLAEMPKHWQVRRIKTVGRAIIGLTYTPEDIVDENEGRLVLRAGNIRGGALSLENNVYVDRKLSEDLKIRVGDIVICARNGSSDLIGKNAVATQEVVGETWGAFMAVLRSDINGYLRWVLNSDIFRAQTGLFSTSTINQLTSRTLHNLKFGLPPEDERDEISRYLDGQTSRIDDLISESEDLISLSKERRSALITAAVTGQIDVRTTA